MRDFQETFGMYGGYIDDTPKPYFGIREQWSLSPIQTFGKARADVTVSDHVIATPYWAYRFEQSPGESRSALIGPEYKFSWYCYCGLNRYSTVVGIVQPFFPESAVNKEVIGSEVKYTPKIGLNTIVNARASAIKKIESTTAGVNLGISIGEAGQTWKFIYESTEKAIKAAIALKKGNVSLALYHLGLKEKGGIASTYLAYQFGFKPLMNDVQNAVKATLDTLERKGEFTVKSTYVDRVQLLYNPLLQSHDLIEGCQVGYSVRIDNKQLAAAQAMGLTNPLALAWELFPLSFVVNWFLSVGDLLGALDAGLGLEITSGYETRFIRGTTTAYGNVAKNGVATGSYFFMERKPLTGIMNPGLALRANLSTGKLVSLAALARQIFK